MGSVSPSIVWFRLDLRLDDNPALDAAVARGGAVIPVFIWSPDEEAPWEPGGASRVWLHDSLGALAQRLRAAGSRLILRQGDALETLRALAVATGAGAVYWNRRYEPAVVARDTGIKAALKEDGLAVESFNGNLLVDPPQFFNKQGTPFKVFTPFFKSASANVPVAEPVTAPRKLKRPRPWPDSVDLASFGLEPKIDWAGGIRAAWTPGEDGAQERLAGFVRETMDRYKEERNHPGTEGTSRMSPHLHFGEVSPRRIVHAVHEATDGDLDKGAYTFVSEVYWREFGYYLLYHFPETPQLPLRPEFQAFPWADDEAGLKRWQKGMTGYPIVDAGMRELWTTGWMHNRVRMVVASFLVKDLLIPWQAGAAWFWDTLVDADLASNTLGWQWTAGCGADAAPYFRVFNPVLQGEKFDPDGGYVREWVPEIAGLPDKFIHKPWEAGADVLASAGVRLGETYPKRLVDHRAARDRALEAYEAVKAG